MNDQGIAEIAVHSGLRRCLDRRWPLLDLCWQLLRKPFVNERHRLFGLLLPALQSTSECIVVRLAMLQRIDEEADQRQLVGNRFEIVRLRHIAGGGKRLDTCTTVLYQCNRTKMAKHGQRTRSLLQGCIQCQ